VKKIPETVIRAGRTPVTPTTLVTAAAAVVAVAATTEEATAGRDITAAALVVVVATPAVSATDTCTDLRCSYGPWAEPTPAAAQSTERVGLDVEYLPQHPARRGTSGT